MGRLSPTAPAPAPAPNGEAAANDLVDILGARMHVDILIPRTGVAGKMRLLSRSENFGVTSAARRFLKEHGFPTEGDAGLSSVTSLGTADEWNMELIARTLQKAVRDPKNVELELATIEDWRDCDDDQLLSLHRDYKDLGDKLDPLGSKKLTPALVALIEQSAKKKDADLLMDCGSRVLALFLISSADQPATSTTPSSSSGP